MSKYSKYQILTGPLAGTTVVAHQLFVRATPDGVVDMSLGEGIWIPALKVRVAAEKDQFGQPTAYHDIVAPFDRFNHEIVVGDTLHAISNKEVVRVTVLGFGKTFNQGCGWFTRQLKVRDLDSGKRFTINNPSGTIKI